MNDPNRPTNFPRAKANCYDYGTRVPRRQDIRDDLINEGIAEAHIDDYLKLLDECDRGRYGRASAQSIDDVGTRANEILANLEGRTK